MAQAKLCAVDGCGKVAAKRQWCEAHYRKWKKYGDPLGTGSILPRVHLTCSVKGCETKHFARGLCRRHYIRWWSNGSTETKSGRAGRLEALKFISDNVSYQGDECLEWPYAKNKGYGLVTANGALHPASRWMCTLAHGEPSDEALQAAHNCGNRGCVNPRHLRWATPAENDSDKIIHGTHSRGEQNGFAKLTEADVIEIRRKAGSVSTKELSAKFGVTQSRILAIISRVGWRHID